MSQLGGPRAALQFLRSQGERDKVLRWLEAVAGNEKRDKKWNGSIPKVQQLVNETSRVWAVLQHVQHVQWPTIASTPDDLKNSLWAFVLRALFDAAIRAHKRAGEPANEDRSHGT